MAKSEKPDVWMPLYIGDYLADTTRLTTEQHGAYLLLIMDYWRNGPPPDDDEVLANITRLSASAWKKHRASIARMFVVGSGEWRHKRVDEELKEAKDNSEKFVARAKNAAAKRWGKQSQDDASSIATSNATSITQEHLEQCPSPSPSPIKPPIASGLRTSGVSTPAGEVCARLMKIGIQAMTPQHPKLLALLEAGLTVEEIVAVGPEAKEKGKGFAWILATAEGRRRDAATVAALPAKAEKPWFMSASGIEAKGIELGMAKARDEVFPMFKQRVLEAAGVTDDMVRRANIDFGGVGR